MGRRRLLPRQIVFIHPRFQTPIWAILLGVSIQVVFTLVSSVNIAVNATGFLYLLTFIFTMFAFYISRKDTSFDNNSTHFLIPLYPFLPILALAISLCLLIPVGKSGFLSGLLWIVIGLSIYFLRKKRIRNVKGIQIDENEKKLKVEN